MLLNVDQDPMGTAIREYYRTGSAQLLKVTSSLFEDDEMPVAHLFRTPLEMGVLERQALSSCKGEVLDVGAGAGCHSLALQERNLSVTAIDVSPLSIETMRARGVRQAELADFFTASFPRLYDTILMLMNGIGIVGKVSRFPEFFRRLDLLLAPGGCVLADSSDLRYVFEDEDGDFDASVFDHYYGEIDYRMFYGKISGRHFDWLYVDIDTLRAAAHAAGYQVDLLREGDHYDYLARITRRQY